MGWDVGRLLVWVSLRELDGISFGFWGLWLGLGWEGVDKALGVWRGLIWCDVM